MIAICDSYHTYNLFDSPIWNYYNSILSSTLDFNLTQRNTIIFQTAILLSHQRLIALS